MGKIATSFIPLFALNLCSEMWYNAHVDGLEQIMYGVTNFALMRAENAYSMTRRLRK